MPLVSTHAISNYHNCVAFIIAPSKTFPQVESRLRSFFFERTVILSTPKNTFPNGKHWSQYNIFPFDVPTSMVLFVFLSQRGIYS